MIGLDRNTVIVGFDFSTGSVKGLAYALDGTLLTETYLPTDLWTADGVSELNLMLIEGQVHTTVRSMADRLRTVGRLDDWAAIGISATHHTAGRIDAHGNQIRRAICWNDQTLGEYHAKGLARLGGVERAKEHIGGPWAIRYSLSHLIKDEFALSAADWERTRWVLPHGALVAGYMTGRFDVTSVSSAASTGIMDLRTNQWCLPMLGALESPAYQKLAQRHLPSIIEATEAIGPLAEHLGLEAGIRHRPLVFPTNDDQQAGLIGGGAVAAGEAAIILGNSAVVNSSAEHLPRSGSLDAMRLNCGPYLWMRCYNNGAQFLDRVVGPRPDWSELERKASEVAPGCTGTCVMPFALPEPSRNVNRSWVEWSPAEPRDAGIRYRAALEALTYLIAMGVQEHEAAGQRLNRIIVSGGIAKSHLIGEILASVLGRPIETLESSEGPALGAAVAGLWALENFRRRERGISEKFDVRDAIAAMVKYRATIQPNPAWIETYSKGLAAFENRLNCPPSSR
jgi:sugar (pentulose or hexulose) kinase